MKRNPKVSINDNDIVECRDGESLFQVLMKSGFTFHGHCGGKGICGRCFVEIEEQTSPEKNSKKRKQVLSCQYAVQSDISVYTGNLWQCVGNENIADSQLFVEPDAEEIGVAVDLGSTTIAVSCMDIAKQKEIAAFSFTNPQYIYGADVISRIRFCMGNEKNALLLRHLVEDTLQNKLKERLKSACSHIRKIIYSGNTTMLHLLQGFSVDGLSASPFTPVSTDYAEVEENGIKIVFPPGFSAFVGADILTGAQYLGMGKMKDYDLLIDLGTNGEMLLLNNHSGYAAATACGTVFDSAVNGAAYGSESIKAIANCVKRRLIDRTGKIAEPYFNRGIEIDKDFVIRQENIRNLQLAKGAVYAGIQCLLKQAGITADDIANVYISGGLGFYLDIRDAFTIKMLPKELAGKIKISENTSLEGAKKLVLVGNTKQPALLSAYEALRNRTVSLELAELDGFQEIYMQSLDF